MSITSTEALRLAVATAAGIIPVGQADGLTEDDLALARQALDLPTGQRLTRQQRRALAQVASLGIDYWMAAGYGDDAVRRIGHLDETSIQHLLVHGGR